MSGNVTNASGATLIELHLANNTEADLTSNILTLQMGWCTDTLRLLLKDASANIYRVPTINSSDVMAIPQRISRYGDTDTYIDLHDDEIEMVAGGVELLNFTETTQDAITINPAGGDVDVSVLSNGSDIALYVDGDTGNVGVNTSVVDHTLSVNGTVGASSSSESAPAYRAFSDTNTGMFFPAADTLAWSTAGVERARITSSGGIEVSVGINAICYEGDVVTYEEEIVFG